MEPPLACHLHLLFFSNRDRENLTPGHVHQLEECFGHNSLKLIRLGMGGGGVLSRGYATYRIHGSIVCYIDKQK